MNFLSKVATLLLLAGLALRSQPQTPSYVLLNPTGNQTITQPANTFLWVQGGLQASHLYTDAINIGDSFFWTDPNTDLTSIANLGVGNITFDTTQSGQGGTVTALLDGNNGGALSVVDSGNNANFFCAQIGEDTVGVGAPNACHAFDIFDVSNRETFGDGYMHWYADGVSYTQVNGTSIVGWNAGISNPSTGVISFDTTTNGNAAATIKAGTLEVTTIHFPNGSEMTEAGSGSGSGGAVTATSLNVGSGFQVTSGGVVQQGALQYGNVLFPVSADGLDVTNTGTNRPGVIRLYGNGSAGSSLESYNNYTNQSTFSRMRVDANGVHPGGYTFLSESGGGQTTGPIYFRMNSTDAITITPDGNVGVGTTIPGFDLAGLTAPHTPPASGTKIFEVAGDIALSYHGGGSMYFPDGSQQSTAWNGTTYGGDYAESVDVLGDRQTYEPGDLIVIDDQERGKFNKSDKAYSRMVAGVYSTKPGLVGRRVEAARPNREAEVPMAMMGIAPTKVTTENGPIEPGDLLVSSSITGYAMKGTDQSRLMGAVIGKALEPLKSGKGTIEVLITLQ